MLIAWGIAADLLWLESHGEVSFEEWYKTVDAAMAHTAHRPGIGVVHDWSRLRVLPGFGELLQRAEYVGRLPSCRWALAVEKQAAPGEGRIAEILAEAVDIAEAQVHPTPGLPRPGRSCRLGPRQRLGGTRGLRYLSSADPSRHPPAMESQAVPYAVRVTRHCRRCDAELDELRCPRCYLYVSSWAVRADGGLIAVGFATGPPTVVEDLMEGLEDLATNRPLFEGRQAPVKIMWPARVGR